MNQIIITIVYDPPSGEVGVNVARLGEDKSQGVNLKDVLTALNTALGTYIGALQVPVPDDSTTP